MDIVIGPEGANTTWPVLRTFDDPADQLDTFNFLFDEILDEHAPLKTISLCLQPNSYITDEIHHLMAKRCLAALNKPMAWSSYKSLCQEVKLKIRLAKKELLA